MKIDSSTGLPSSRPADAPVARRADAGAASTPTSLPIGDLTVELTSVDTPLAQAPVDSAGIARIKEAIRNGQFKVNPEAVADRLLDSVRQMLGNKA